MDHRHQAQSKPSLGRLWRTLAIPRPLPHVCKARHCHLVQADHSRPTVVLHPAHHDHHHVHGRVWRHRKNQHRRTPATAILPRRHLPVDLFFGMPEPDQQNIHRKREHVRQGVLSAPRGAARHRHEQPRATQHPDGPIFLGFRILHDFHRCSGAPQRILAAHTGARRINCSPCPGFRRAVQQSHHQIS